MPGNHSKFPVLCPAKERGLAVRMGNFETPDARRTRYLRYAAEAEEMALRSREDQLKRAYLALAKSWRGLAEEGNPKIF